ncbi:MAG: hypothetical protein KAX11_08485, partial [Candidatus Aminicenantes bacterium]|nr:hypothetical protein [Candidatus Aminicenantes bacterium]
NSKKIMNWTMLITFSLTLVGCSSVNYLRNYKFRDHTVAADMLVPPRPQVFTDSFVGIDTSDPIGTALRVGTTIVKEIEAAEAQKRMDRALEKVNVPQRIKERMLQRCAKVLKSRPTDDTEHAEFLLDMEIRNYGIDAKSWTAGTDFKIDVLVQILDNQTSALVWRRRIKERQPISREIFGLGHAADNVISAVALSSLSEDEIATGFRHLADYTADRIAAKLQKDLVKARRR